MDAKNLFKIMIGISVIAHGAIIWRMPIFRQFTFIPDKKIEVSYCFINKEKQFSVYKEKDSLDNIKPKQEKLILSKIPQEIIKAKLETVLLEPKVESKPPMAQAVNLTNIQSEYRRNPTELNKYYFEIWEKIRHSAYQELYNERSLTGEVRLVFSISNIGQILDIEIIEDSINSLPNNLKKAGSRSVRNASPFQSFPKELGKDKEFFDIIISFEPR
ncbi:MAG: hypothetical protein AB1755_00750 [Candidatus Omnitrophota bacterium]